MFFGKKKEKQACCCDVSTDMNNCNEVSRDGIIVLGSGCKKCNDLESNVRKALHSLGIEEEIKHITDFGVIASFGVMSTPALVIDNKVVSYGKVLSEAESLEILKKHRD